MPSKSEKQRRYIFYLRGKYKTKEDTPKKYKWIWEKDWERVEESQLFDVMNFSDYLEIARLEDKEEINFESDFLSAGKFVESGKREEEFEPRDKFEKELERGIEVEMEHTNNREIAKRIALDHITEAWPESYYDRLEEMEREIEEQKKKTKGE